MPQPQLSGQALHDVHKVVFLANEYPGKTAKELAKLFDLSALDINNAMWRAEDLGYLVVDRETNKYTVDTVPDTYEFGDDVKFLREQVIYAFQHLATTEADMEENYLANWTLGYSASDLSIVVKGLLADKILSTYEVGNTVEVKPGKPAKGQRTDTYLFYTLTENLAHEWGRKQFKDASRLS